MNAQQLYNPHRSEQTDDAPPITASSFTLDPGVMAAVSKIKTLKKHYSDVIDDAGHQYVDLVMESAGMMGIALIGYTYGLEQAGIRFLGIGGISSGSVNAIFLAMLGTPDEAKGERAAEILANMPLYSFLDGNKAANDIAFKAIERLPDWSWLWTPSMIYKVPQLIYTLSRYHGINAGHAFHKWLTHTLAEKGIHNNADLNAKLDRLNVRLRRDIPDGEDHPTVTTAPLKASFQIVVSDITTGSKVELPHHAALYWPHPDVVNPADFVRAAMSIPIFYYPFHVRQCPPVVDPTSQHNLWRKYLSYDGKPPISVQFIDGGVVSNFPITLFHAPFRIPRAPTFGVKLSPRRNLNTGKNIYSMMSDIFNVSRRALDYDYIINHPDYHHIVQHIKPTPHEFHWLDLNMQAPEKIALFRLGVESAAEFLTRFDWKKYKAIRKGMAEAMSV
jgi:NTE family protein